MKILRFFLGIVLSFSLIFIALISSVEIAAYSDFSFYEKEYNKYAVTSSVDISMPELMNVTKDMMAYLKRDYQVDVLLSDSKAAQRKYRDAVIDHVSIDEIMLLLIKGERR